MFPAMQSQLVRLFEVRFGVPPTAILEIGGDGSSRSYWRLVGPEHETAVGAVGPNREENRTFFAFTRAFRSIGLPVPELYGVDEEAGVWLLEDLGDTTLYESVVLHRGRTGERFPEPVRALYERVVEVLPRFQLEGPGVIDFDLAYPRSAFDRQSMLWDLNYFKYHFLKLAHVPFNEARLERDFHTLTDFLLEAPQDAFLYRDFQSRNVMIRDGEPWFVDYQGGRRGALQYDIASLLYDGKADLPPSARAAILDHYLGALAERRRVDRDDFLRHFRGYVLIRVMQAMGAYGYRGFFERKPRFLDSVPFAARNLARLLEEGLPVALPELEGAFEAIVTEWAGQRPTEDDGEALTVRVGSFSYKKGYPEDRGGHGGGFVFDCRALPNPGRDVKYAPLCGLDEPVVDYLLEMPEVEQFWESTRALVDAQVQEYLRRGFRSLTVTYGCTGGQHRSVFFAERLARHIRGRHPDVRVVVSHRERRAWPGSSEREADAAAEPAKDAPASGGRRARAGEPAGGGRG